MNVDERMSTSDAFNHLRNIRRRRDLCFVEIAAFGALLA
jgi:hypothetical protein